MANISEGQIRDIHLALVRSKEYVESNRDCLRKQKYLTPCLDSKLKLIDSAIHIISNL